MIQSDRQTYSCPPGWTVEESFRRLVELSPDVIFTLSAADGTIMSLSPAFERLTGLSRGEWIGRHFAGLVHPDDLPRARETFERAVRGESVPPIELRFRTRSGDYCIGEVISQVFSEQGKVVGVFGFARDVTERRATEAALRRSEEQLRLLVEGIKDHAVFMLDASGRIVSWNAGGQRVLGYREEEILGRHFSCLYCTDDILGGMPERHLHQAETTGQTQDEGWRVRKEGARFWAEAVIFAIRQEGELRGFACLVRDITARKQTSEAVRATQQWLQHLLSSSPAVIYSSRADGDYRTHFVSENIIAQLGYHPWEFLKDSRFWQRLVHPDDVARVIRERERLKETGHQVLEYRVRHRSGSYRWLRDELRLVRDAEGVPVEIVGCWIDITERKEAEEQLERSLEQLRALSARLQSVREEERTRIAREIHDELGQAMTGLKMDLAWLARQLPTDAPSLRQKVGSMSHLVDETIQVVRRISTELRPGVLDDLGLLAALEWQAQEFQTRTGIRCRLTTNVEELELDTERSTALFRIFQETLTNVARHAQATEVTVRLDLCEAHLILEVKDNGVGISSQALTDSHSLGLLGMRERALLFGGSLDVRGEPERGTTVTVRIPLMGGT